MFWRITAFTSASIRSISSRGERGAVAEVEADAVGVDHLALLGHVRAQHVAQGRVQQVGRGVVGAGAGAPLGVDEQVDVVARGQPARADPDPVHVQVAGVLVGVEHLARAAGPLRLAHVAGLAAALGVEGGAVEQDLDLLAGLRRVGRATPSARIARVSPSASTWS